MARWGPIGLLVVALAAPMIAAPARAAPQLAGRTSLPDGTVRFKSGSAELTTESEATLRQLAALLKARPELDPVLLVGHADDRGAEATNVALSKRRADSVREHLVRLGVARSRLRTEGAGSVDPLVDGTTDEARRTNRRVEVWVTPQGAVARVAKVERKVLSKEAAAPSWRDAKVDMPLRRLAQVRTMKQSSSEIRFERDDRIALGPEALVVIFGSPKKTARSRRSVQDIEVRRGSIFASLAEREGRSLDVETGAGRVDVASKKTRIDVRPKRAEKRRASTVSVFSGRSSVSNRGRTVVVKEGFGTRVEEGRAPEPARPLPPAPKWTAVTPLEAFAGEPVALSWIAAPGVAGAEVQVGLQGDPEVQRPVRLREVGGTSERVTFARGGIYYVRLAGIDERGVRGAPSVMRRIVVLPKPRGRALTFGAPASGAARTSTAASSGAASGTSSLPAPRDFAPAQCPPHAAGSGARGVHDCREAPVGLPMTHVGAPQRLEFAAPRGTSLRLGAATSSASVPYAAFRPGRHAVTYTVTATAGDVATGRVALDVAPLEVTATAERGADTVAIELKVTASGRPVEGLSLLAREVAAARSELGIPLGVTSTIGACVCGIDGAPLEDLGEGRYRIALPIARDAAVIVRIVEPRGPLGMEIAIPGARRAPPAPPTSKPSGFFGGAGVGATLSPADAPGAFVFVEGGARIRLTDPIDLDLSALAGWAPHGDVHAFPVLGRAALSYTFGAPRVFAGGGAGARFASPSDTAAAFDVFAGLAYALGLHGELRLEGHYLALGEVEGDPIAGFTVTLGYRHGTWRW